MRNLKKTIGLAVAVAGLMLAGLAPAASANVYMWEDSYYRGDLYVDYSPGENWDDRYDIDWWDGDDEISSVKNYTSKWLTIYANDGYTGSKRCVEPGGTRPNLSWISFNDEAESFALHDDRTC